MTVVFPRPPPTYNTLSPAQRSQLLRSTSKLGQLLGSTPHIIDDTIARRQYTPPRHNASLDYGRRSGSPASRTSTSSRGSSSSETVSSDSHASTSTAASSSHPDDGHRESSWRSRFPARKPPLLRVGRMGNPSLETIPGSPPPTNSPPSPLSNFDSPPDSPPSPSFAIPSASAARRQKMRRLAKRLGEGVPVHLVFPPTDESDEEGDGDGVIVGFDAPTHHAACKSVESVVSWKEREERARERSEKAPLWDRQTVRRSKFAKSTVVSGKYVVHYQDEGMHGEETFLSVGCPRFATIPEGMAC